MEKLFVVFGMLDRNSDGEYRVYGAFRSRKSAEDYMISIARQAFDDLGVLAESRSCLYNWNDLIGIVDNWDYLVEVYLVETEIKD